MCLPSVHVGLCIEISVLELFSVSVDDERFSVSVYKLINSISVDDALLSVSVCELSFVSVYELFSDTVCELISVSVCDELLPLSVC